MSDLHKVVPASEIRKRLSKTSKRIWCPGCGTGIALGGMIRAMVESEIPEDRIQHKKTKIIRMIFLIILKF